MALIIPGERITINSAGKSRVMSGMVINTGRLPADVLYVMDNGRIVESGSHDALLSAGGLYTKLYASLQ